MAAPSGPRSGCWAGPEVYQHHQQRTLCISRPKYREGRKAKAVKVYTINLESRYVMIQGVPAIGVMPELIQLCALYGVVEEYRPLDEYPAEEFTEVFLVKFQRVPGARAAKRHMDEKSFYGGVLHVCYVPEYESVEDTRLKLQDRKRYVIRAAEKARREERKKSVNKEAASGDAVSTSVTRHQKAVANKKPEASNAGLCYGFPPLPFPPREYCYSTHTALPTEDKMGTLDTAVTEANPRPSPSCSRPSDGDEVDSGPSAALAFVPRSTRPGKRKLKLEENTGLFWAGPGGRKEPLIGPKLPEAPRLDMEDESLNTTMNLIRNAMKKVESVSDSKPVEKKVKPRRRI